MLVVGSYSSTFRKRYRWLFGRIRRGAYCHDLLWFVKSTALALIPAGLVSEPPDEVLTIICVLHASLVLHCRIRPWGADAATLAEATVAYIIVLRSAGAKRLLAPESR